MEEAGSPNGRKLANKIVLGQLNAKLKNDDTIDLGGVLKQQLTSYPKLVQNLSKRNKPTPGRSSMSPPGDLTPPYAIDSDSSHVTHALSGEIVALLSNGDAQAAAEWLGSPSNHLPRAFGDALNQMLRDGEELHSLHENWVIGIGTNTVVKIGTSIDPDQINNLLYVNNHCDVPTPNFLGALSSGLKTYVFLSRAPGVSLESVWPQLSKVQKLSIQQQLVSCFQSLRATAPQKMPVQLGSFQSGICKDMRRSLRLSAEPLYSETDFNDFLCRDRQRTATAWITMVRSFMREDHRIVMTHGDLHPRNIMVNLGDGHGEQDGEGGIELSSILDWELAGWYPEHWEFVRALSTIDIRDGPLQDWVEYLPTEAIGKYPIEYSLDSLVGRWLG